MKTNDIFALLKTFRGLAVSLIKNRQPDDLPAAIRALRAQLDKAAAAASEVNFGALVPESVTFPINELMAQAALVQGDVCSNRDDLFVAKSIKPEDFVAYAAAEVEKGTASESAREALSVGYSLLKRIDKAIEPFAALSGKPLPAEMDTFVFYKEDAEEAATARKAAADAVAKGETAPAPGSWVEPVEGAVAKSADEVKATITETVGKATKIVEKAEREIVPFGGWGRDLATKRFLDGEGPKVDFGRDPVKR
jgi:hypothetical protein